MLFLLVLFFLNLPCFLDSCSAGNASPVLPMVASENRCPLEFMGLFCLFCCKAYLGFFLNYFLKAKKLFF